MKSITRYLIGLTVIFTIGLMGWTIVSFFRHRGSRWGAAILVYLVLVGLVIVLVWRLLYRSAPHNDNVLDRNDAPSPQPSPARKKEDLKKPEEIVLKIIREKGRAKRADFLPHAGISKSSLVRLLDEMEERGLIVQVGEKKGAYYTLKGSGP